MLEIIVWLEIIIWLEIRLWGHKNFGSGRFWIPQRGLVVMPDSVVWAIGRANRLTCASAQEKRQGNWE